MASSKMTWELIGKDKSASKAIGGVQSKLGGVQGALKKVAIAAGVAFAAKKALDFGKDLIVAGEAAATSDARIQQIATSMGIWGGEADNVSKRLIDLANAQAIATGEDQNAIKMSQAKLLTFKEVANSAGEMGGVFDRATQATIDLAAAGFGTTADNAIQLGKALNDPIKGISALTRSGVTFTAAEKDKIKTMVESGQVAQAQDMILASIEQQVGGTAAATRNATDQMAVGWSVLMEKMGTLVLPAFNAVAGVILDKVFPAASQLIDWVGNRVTPALKGLYDLVVGGDFTGAFADAFGVAEDSKVVDFILSLRESVMGFDFSVFSPLVDGFKAVFSSVGPIIPQLLEAASAFSPLHLVFKALMPVIPQLAALVGDFITNGIALITPVIMQVVPIISQLAALLVTGLTQAFTNIVPLIGFLMQTMMSLLPVVLSLVPPILGVVEALMPLVNVVIQLIGSLLPPLVDIFTALLTPIIALIPPLVESLSPILTTIADIISTYLVPMIQWLASMLGSLLKWLAPVIAALAGGLVTALGAVIQWVANAAAGIVKFVSGALGKFTEWRDGIRRVVDKVVGWFKDLPGRISSAVTGLWDGLTSSFKEAVNWIIRKWNDFSLTIGGGTILGVEMPSVTLNTPNIPYLASGGILTKPTMFVGGEGGEPEVVTPLSRLGEFMRDYAPRDAALAPASTAAPTIGDLTLHIYDTDGVFQGTIRSTAAQQDARMSRDRRLAIKGK